MVSYMPVTCLYDRCDICDILNVAAGLEILSVELVPCYLAAAAAVGASTDGGRLRSLSWERRRRRRGHTWYNLSTSAPTISQIWPLLWRLPRLSCASANVALKRRFTGFTFSAEAAGRSHLIQLGNLLTLASGSLVCLWCTCPLYHGFSCKKIQGEGQGCSQMLINRVGQISACRYASEE